MRNYQPDYASSRPQMYDKKSRRQRALRIVKTLEDYYKNQALLELTVLDVGASTGIMDKELAEYFGKIVGIDIDQDAISFANKKNGHKNLSFRVDDAMNLSFRDNTFDIVICAQVYEHVPDAKKMFREIYRVLKPGGVCYLAALNRIWPLEPHYDLFFLTWIPRSLANKYLQIARGIPEYYEKTATYWGLRSMTKKFRVVDYTAKILNNPIHFGYKKLPVFISLLAMLLKYLTPTFFWILVKKK